YKVAALTSFFIQKLFKTFESSGKADISFNRLRHYEQGINQDVRQYYFEIMKLCKEANPFMDDAKFLEYAQKIAELKSLDEQEDVTYRSNADDFTPSSPDFLSHRDNKSRFNNRCVPTSQRESNKTYYQNNYVKNKSFRAHPVDITKSNQYHTNNIQKPPYQCYKCGGTDHYIHDCPHFYQGS
ncbi:unnamed protein product, partial [Rotaria magnacalcarata]